MSFSKVQGQRRATKILEGFLAAERIPSALVFSGLEGVGKTLMAREFAKALLCEEKKAPAEPCGDCGDCAAVDKGLHPDVQVADAAYQAGLVEGEAAKQRLLQADTLRHLRRDMELQSMLGRWKTAIVCEAHTLTEPAANVLLKSLEEPPPRTVWILVTAQKDRLPKTVLSRCFPVAFSPLARSAVEALLAQRGIADASRLSALSEGSVSRALELAQMPEPSGSAGPLAPLEAADALPRELHLARTQVELALFALAQGLRAKHLRGALSFGLIERPLKELARLRQALRSNADPRTVLLLAGLQTEGL
ncbi:MAG: DNA polymerase III subunit [Elusimicrobia bacterium]|nr:DNA polymerase III subunit [Elusimicrobiota bacterium]